MNMLFQPNANRCVAKYQERSVYLSSHLPGAAVTVLDLDLDFIFLSNKQTSSTGAIDMTSPLQVSQPGQLSL